MFEPALAPILDIRREIIPVPCDDITLDFHVWRPVGPRVAVFLLPLPTSR